MLTHGEIKSYLNRIGVSDIQIPSRSYLSELHKAHVENLPWQTIDIFAGNPVAMDISEAIKLIINRRSGYCFHLNGAFSELLRSLGFKVFLHRAGVQPHGQQPRINSFHLGLSVLLKNEQGDEEKWIIDVGLGDMPYEPIPLQFGDYEQGPFLYKVVQSNVVENGWRLEHDPKGSCVGVDFAPEVVQDIDEFKPKHHHYSYSTDSPWINLFLIRHRHATGSNELRGCVLREINYHGVKKTEITSKSQWLEVLGDIFGEHLVNYTTYEREELWKRTKQIHENWKKSIK